MYLNAICAGPSLQLLSQSFPTGLFSSLYRFLPMWYSKMCPYAFLSSFFLPLLLLPLFFSWIQKCLRSCVYIPFQFALKILPSFCDFILSFFALIFASPLVLSLKTHKQNYCNLFLYRILKMLSYPSSQIKLVYCFHGCHLLEHLLLASFLASSFNLWIFTGCFSLSH